MTVAGDDIVRQCDVLAAEVLRRCETHEVMVAAAESLTGGLLADAFVRIPGASRVFVGSAVTYDIRAKASILHVDPDLLRREGAVHPQVARQMAESVARLYDQPQYRGRVIGLSTTGVAGPGPDGIRPAGLVYIGIAIPAGVLVSGKAETAVDELHCQGSRECVRHVTVLRILQNLSRLTANLQE